MSSTAAPPASPAAARAWVVHKFGGSSVADADCFRRVADIVESQPSPRMGIVLSACKGVTDALLNLVTLAERQDEGYVAQLQVLRDRHRKLRFAPSELYRPCGFNRRGGHNSDNLHSRGPEAAGVHDRRGPPSRWRARLV